MLSMTLRHVVLYIATQCPFLFPKSVLGKNVWFPLHRNVSESSGVWKSGQRGEGTMHFVGGLSTTLDLPFTLLVLSMSAAVPSPVNILYYLLLQYLPTLL